MWLPSSPSHARPGFAILGRASGRVDRRARRLVLALVAFAVIASEACGAETGDACDSDTECPSSACNGGKCCAPATIRRTPLLLGIDTLCQTSGYSMISTKAECEAAAKSIGMPAISHTAKMPAFSIGNPPGCFRYPSQETTGPYAISTLYFNPQLTGTIKRATFKPLCHVTHECATCTGETGACATCDEDTQMLVDGQCRANPGETCVLDVDCGYGACGKGVCCGKGGCSAGEKCDADSDCGTGDAPCRANTCLAGTGDDCDNDAMCPSSSCNGGKCCAPATIRRTPLLLGKDTLCKTSGYSMITTKAECEAAAKAAGMSGISHTAGRPVFSAGNPPGCFKFLLLDRGNLFFNPSLTGTYTRSSFAPLCHVLHECATCAAETGACVSCADDDILAVKDGQCRAVGGESCNADDDCFSRDCASNGKCSVATTTNGSETTRTTTATTTTVTTVTATTMTVTTVTLDRTAPCRNGLVRSVGYCSEKSGGIDGPSNCNPVTRYDFAIESCQASCALRYPQHDYQCGQGATTQKLATATTATTVATKTGTPKTTTVNYCRPAERGQAPLTDCVPIPGLLPDAVINKDYSFGSSPIAIPQAPNNHASDGKFGTSEWDHVTPAIGRFTNAYIDYADGFLYILNDWIYNPTTPVSDNCYNLFTAFTGSGQLAQSTARSYQKSHS
eukprot:gene2213-15079_t